MTGIPFDSLNRQENKKPLWLGNSSPVLEESQTTAFKVKCQNWKTAAAVKTSSLCKDCTNTRQPMQRLKHFYSPSMHLDLYSSPSRSPYPTQQIYIYSHSFVTVSLDSTTSKTLNAIHQILLCQWLYLSSEEIFSDFH